MLVVIAADCEAVSRGSVLTSNTN